MRDHLFKFLNSPLMDKNTSETLKTKSLFSITERFPAGNHFFWKCQSEKILWPNFCSDFHPELKSRVTGAEEIITPGKLGKSVQKSFTEIVRVAMFLKC